MEQQLDLYTSITIPRWLEAQLTYQENPIVFLNQYQGRWDFTERDVRRYLAAHPKLIDAYFSHCRNLRNYHDKVILEHKGVVYLVYTTDHGVPRDIEWFVSKTKAVIRWLEYRYMN